jgi:RNA polymerase sigma-70 factor (ECF subfamily)
VDPIAKTSILPVAVAAERTGPSALEEEVVHLFDQLRAPVLRYLLSLGLTVQDGEEIAQEVFLALFRHLRLGKSRANVRGWVFRVAHNLGLKRREAARRYAEPQEIHAHDPAPDPEVQFANAQRQDRMLAVLRALAEHDRQCLYLRAEGLRYREIAKVLEISLGAVSNSLARSLAKIAQVAEK